MDDSSAASTQNTNVHEPPGAARATVGATAMLGTGILASRVLGLVREMLAAKRFGATRVRDCFNVASQLPFAIHTGVGTLLTGAVIPVFTSYISRRKENEGWRVVGTVCTILLVTLAVVWAVATAAAGRLAPVLGPGFEPEWESVTARLLRLTLPYLVVASLGAIFLCIVLSYQRFLPPAVAHAVPNVLIIAALLGLGESLQIDALAIGWVLGGIGFTVALLPAVWRLKGGRPLLALDVRDQGVKQVGRLCLPLAIPTALGPIVAMAKRALASELRAGGIAELDYAEDIALIPVGILVAATSTVVLPKLAQQVARDDVEGMKRLISIGLRLVVALTVPAMVLAMMLRHSIVRVLFQRGQFGPQATSRVAEVLLWSGGTLVAAGFVEVLTRSFHACQDTLTPSAVSVGGSLVRLCLMLATVGPLGIRGLAASGWLTQGLISGAMATALRRRLGPMGGRRIGRCFLGISVAGLAMALVLRVTMVEVLPAWHAAGGTQEALWLALQCAIGAGVYILLVLIFNPADRRAAFSHVSGTRGQERASGARPDC
jgi:putative peptidoglycan lipid II flippase